MAYDFLHTKWTGLCAPATLIPDVDIPEDEALPVPSFDYIGGRPTRAIQMIPLLAGFGISAGMATGAAGLGTTFELHRLLSAHLVSDIKAVSVFELQNSVFESVRNVFKSYCRRDFEMVALRM